MEWKTRKKNKTSGTRLMGCGIDGWNYWWNETEIIMLNGPRSPCQTLCFSLTELAKEVVFLENEVSDWKWNTCSGTSMEDLKKKDRHFSGKFIFYFWIKKVSIANWKLTRKSKAQVPVRVECHSSMYASP